MFKNIKVPSQAHVYQMLVAELDKQPSQASYVSENAEVNKNTAACLDDALKIMSNQYVQIFYTLDLESYKLLGEKFTIN